MKLSTTIRAAAILSVALVPTTVLPAAATASPWNTVHEVYDPVTFENFCGVEGLTVVASGSIDHRDRTVARSAESLPYYAEHTTDSVDIFTNTATGAFVTHTGHYTLNTVSVRDNGDGTLTVISQYTINTRTTDEAGQLVARDTGIQRYVSVVDHNGTPSDPTDDTELESSDLLETGLEPGGCPVLVAAIT